MEKTFFLVAPWEMREKVITRRNFLISTGVGLASIPALRAARAADFTVTIARKFSDATCTSGYLAVDGKVIAYTLELPWAGNQPLMSSIPAGSYSGILRYDHPDKWRIELQGVPGRNVVQIHTGNTPDDTEGCILVGAALDDDLCSIKGGTSVQAYSALRTAFYGTPNPIATPNKSIVVKVEQ